MPSRTLMITTAHPQTCEVRRPQSAACPSGSSPAAAQPTHSEERAARLAAAAISAAPTQPGGAQAPTRESAGVSRKGVQASAAAVVAAEAAAPWVEPEALAASQGSPAAATGSMQCSACICEHTTCRHLAAPDWLLRCAEGCGRMGKKHAWCGSALPGTGRASSPALCHSPERTTKCKQACHASQVCRGRTAPCTYAYTPSLPLTYAWSVRS